MTKKAINVEQQSVSFDFEDDGEVVTASLSDFSEDIVRKLALHGLSQKCGDSYAGAKGAIEGTEMTVAEYARGQVGAVIKQLTEGEWTTRQPGKGGTATDLANALSIATGSSIDDCIARLANASKEDKAALRKHPAIKAELDRIKADRAAKKAADSAANAGDGPDLSEFMG